MTTWDVGYVGKARGLRGEVRVHLHLPDPRVLDVDQVWLSDDDGARDLTDLVSVDWVDAQLAVVRFKGHGNRVDAEALRGKTVSVERAWFQDPDDAPLFSFLGARVVNDEDESDLGEVTSIAHNGAQPIAVIERDGEEHMMPIVEAFVIGLVVTDGVWQLRVRPIPGMFGD